MRNHEQRRADVAARTGKPIEEIEAAEKLLEAEAHKVDFETLREIFGNPGEFRGTMEAMDAIHEPMDGVLKALAANCEKYNEEQAALAILMTSVLLVRLFGQDEIAIIRMTGQACVLASTFEQAMANLRENPFKRGSDDD